MDARVRGFSLIELVVVTAIIAILAAVAVPNYSRYVARTNRAAAQALMQDMANLQARYLVDARRYATTLAQLGVTIPADVGNFYTVALVTDNAATPPTWSITATPSGTQATQDAACGAIALNQAGTKSATGTTAAADCWAGR